MSWVRFGSSARTVEGSHRSKNARANRGGMCVSRLTGPTGQEQEVRPYRTTEGKSSNRRVQGGPLSTPRWWKTLAVLRSRWYNRRQRSRFPVGLPKRPLPSRSVDRCTRIPGGCEFCKRLCRSRLCWNVWGRGQSMKNEWILYVVLAGLSWGTYVPLIFYGGSELGGKSGARMMAILCVGVAYFVIAVLFPLYMFL